MSARLAVTAQDAPSAVRRAQRAAERTKKGGPATTMEPGPPVRESRYAVALSTPASMDGMADWEPGTSMCTRSPSTRRR